jgi:ABC-type amino acid transport substrate-binding protein
LIGRAIALSLSLAVAVPIAVAAQPAVSASPAATASPAVKPAPLRVCFLEDDAPRAQRATDHGFDLDVMRAVAAASKVDLVPIWSPSHAGFSEVERSDLPLGRLARGECDAAASVPGIESLGHLRSRLALSRPYYGAAFELVTRDRPREGKAGAGSAGREAGAASGDDASKGAAASKGAGAAAGAASKDARGAKDIAPLTLETLAGRKVGVQLQSFAHLVAQSLHLDWQTRPTPAETLAMLDSGEVEAALVWGPALAPLGRAARERRWTPPRALRWNEHVAVRAGSPWLAVIDSALERLLSEGFIDRCARFYRIPARAPFESVSDASALAELRQATARPTP